MPRRLLDGVHHSIGVERRDLRVHGHRGGASGAALRRTASLAAYAAASLGPACAAAVRLAVAAAAAAAVTAAAVTAAALAPTSLPTAAHFGLGCSVRGSILAFNHTARSHFPHSPSQPSR